MAGSDTAADGLHIDGADAVTMLIAAARASTAMIARRHGGPRSGGRSREPHAWHASSYDQLRAAHIADHAALFERVTLDLGRTEAADLPTDERIRRWSDGRSAARRAAVPVRALSADRLVAAGHAAGQPAGHLERPVRPPWSSNWTININTQMNYWPAEVANLAECHQPLFDLIADLSAPAAGRPRSTMAAAAGWRTTTPTCGGRARRSGDYGRGDPVWASWPMGGAWLCQHLWEHYAFGGDRQVPARARLPADARRRRVLPRLADRGRQGLARHIALDLAREQVHDARRPAAGVSMASTMDMAIIWDLFTNCIAASRILGRRRRVRADSRPRARGCCRRRSGRHGQLQEWSQDWDDPDDHHRHVSHLFGLHPGRQITPRGTPELFAAARRSLELRGDGGTGWSMAWKINFWARLLDGDHAYRCSKHAQSGRALSDVVTVRRRWRLPQPVRRAPAVSDRRQLRRDGRHRRDAAAKPCRRAPPAARAAGAWPAGR